MSIKILQLGFIILLFWSVDIEKNLKKNRHYYFLYEHKSNFSSKKQIFWQNNNQIKLKLS